jgi:uncharacterized membrane protein
MYLKRVFRSIARLLRLERRSIDTVYRASTSHEEDELWALLRLMSNAPEILKRERMVRGITQDELSRETTLSRSTISLMENGRYGSIPN